MEKFKTKIFNFCCQRFTPFCASSRSSRNIARDVARALATWVSPITGWATAFTSVVNKTNLKTNSKLIEWTRGVVHSKKSSYTPSPPPRKKSEKFPKTQGFFWGFNIRTPYLGVNNPLVSGFKSFFYLYNSRVPKKKLEKNPKKSKNPKNVKNFKKIWKKQKNLKIQKIWKYPNK